jgi:hypothetical protein
VTSPDWIAALKPGDRVAIERRMYGLAEAFFGRVERLTPSGRIVVQTRAESWTFSPDGWQRTSGHPYRLAELSPAKEQEILEAQERGRLSGRLNRTKWRDLPLETLRAVAALLPEKEKE